MSEIKKRRQPTHIRKEQIKKAMLEIVYAEGMNKVSTRNLAKRVGITEGALFRHFKSKRDIFLDIIEDVHTDLVKNLRDIALSKKTAEIRLSEFLCKHISYLSDHKGITTLIFSEAAHTNDSVLKSKLHQILIQQKQLISKIIQDGIVEGIWDAELHTENVAMMYMGIPISFNIELVLNNNGVKVENFCQRMACLLKRVLEEK